VAGGEELQEETSQREPKLKGKKLTRRGKLTMRREKVGSKNERGGGKAK